MTEQALWTIHAATDIPPPCYKESAIDHSLVKRYFDDRYLDHVLLFEDLLALFPELHKLALTSTRESLLPSKEPPVLSYRYGIDRANIPHLRQ
jgi:hypothetical protein